MALIVQKFGGSSVKDRDRIFNVARIVANTHNAGNDVVVVVSAQGDTTDDLIAKAGEITHNPSAREMDMLLASGEQISISLLAMALNELGCHAISLTGWQAGFRTDRAYTKARITRLETERISSELERNRVVVVAVDREPDGGIALFAAEILQKGERLSGQALAPGLFVQIELAQKQPAVGIRADADVAHRLAVSHGQIVAVAFVLQLVGDGRQGLEFLHHVVDLAFP